MSENLKQPFIHFHIPKTAGTSLRSVLIEQLGPENVAYMLPNHQLVKANELPFTTARLDRVRRVARSAGMLNLYYAGLRFINRRRVTDTFSLAALENRNVALATGHFTPDDITETVAHLPRTTVVREPLARAWSHFLHWQEAHGKMWWHDGSIPYSPDVTFESFAADPQLANYQARHLGGLTFDVIGVASDLPGFLEKIGLDPNASVPQLNPGLRRSRPDFDPGFVENFQAMNAADYALYEQALQSTR